MRPLTRQRRETLLAVVEGHVTTAAIAKHLGLPLRAAKTRINTIMRAGLIVSDRTTGGNVAGRYSVTEAGSAALEPAQLAVPVVASKHRKAISDGCAKLLRTLEGLQLRAPQVAASLGVTERTARRKLQSAESQGLVVTVHAGKRHSRSVYQLTPAGRSAIVRHRQAVVLSPGQEQTILCLAEGDPIDTVTKMAEEYEIGQSAARERFEVCVRDGLVVGTQDASKHGRPLTYTLTQLGRDAVLVMQVEAEARRAAK